jgi:chromosome partitioning protein
LSRLNSGIVREELNTNRPILIDCCPMLGVLSLNAIFAADRVLVPISADYLALQGAAQVDRTLKALEQVLKKRMPRRYVLTRYDARRNMSAQIFVTLKAKYGDEMCDTRISENVSLAESPAVNRDVFTHAPNSRGAADYDALLSELAASDFL